MNREKLSRELAELQRIRSVLYAGQWRYSKYEKRYREVIQLLAQK